MRAFVVGDDDSLLAHVRDVLVRLGFDCPASNAMTVMLANDLLAAAQPDLTIVVMSPRPNETLTAIGRIGPGVWGHVIAVGPADDPRVIMQAMRQGVSDYVDQAEFQDDLKGALARYRETANLTNRQGRVIACVPVCGGCGSSTLSVNIATSLAKEYGRAGLIDFRLTSGDLASLLDLKPGYTLAEFCENVNSMDDDMYSRMMCEHQSGVHLLAAPSKFRDIAMVSAEGMREAVCKARANFPYVVIDADHPAHAEQTESLFLADEILLVLRLEFAALRNCRRILQYLNDLGIERSKVRLVANRFGQPREISNAKATEALGVEDLFYVPDDPKYVNMANNSGVPVVIEKPSSRASISMASLAMSCHQ